MNLRLGINNCFAVKRWPLASEWAEIVSDELELGLVQHSLDLSDLGERERERDVEAEAIRDACARSGVRIHSVFTGLAAYSSNLLLGPSPAGRRRGFEYWARAIRFAAALDAEAVGGHLGSLSRADADVDARRDLLWSELDGALDALRRLAAEAGIASLLVENMACDREPSRIAELQGLMHERDDERAAVALCLDVGHQCVPGTSGDERDPYAWLRTVGGQAAVVHLQQSAADGDGHWPFTAERNAIGRIDGARVLEALAMSSATEVALIIEVIPAFEAEDRVVLAELRETVEYWQQALAAFESRPRGLA